MTYDYSSRSPQPRWRPLHDRNSLRRLRNLRATAILVALRVIAVCFVAALAYVLVGSARPFLERVASPAPVVTPFTRLAPATVRQVPSTPTATAVPLPILVPTMVPPTAVPVLPTPTKRVPTVSATATEDTADVTPTAESSPGTSPTVVKGTPGVLPTVPPLVVATQTAATAEPTSVVAAATPEPPAAPAGMFVYTVQPGDSLWSISQRFQVRYPDLLEANPEIKDPGKIAAGMELLIPALGTELPTE